jgi:hypothetical protein
MGREFWSIICSFRRVRHVALTVLLVFFVLQLLAFGLGIPEGESYYISLINLAIYVPMIGALLYARYRCRVMFDAPE